MEKKNYESKMIKITLLEIKPSLKQLEKNNNEISIIFQGINVFYNIRKLLLNNTEIKINDCKNSIIMSLVKSDTIFASALFNIKPGENWVTFNYESKKKTSLKQNLNYIDCIKIKILCQLEEKLNIKKNLSNNKNKVNSRNINNSRIKKYNKTTSISINNKVSNNSRIKKYRTNINLIQRKKSNAYNDNRTQFRYSSILTEDVNKFRSSVDLGQTNRSTTYYKNSSHKLDFKDFSKKTRNDMSSTLSGFKNGEFSCIIMNNSRFNSSLSSIMKNNKNNLASQKNLKIKNKTKSKMKTQINIKNYNILNKCFDINACLRDNLITDNKNKNERNTNDMDSITKRLSFTNNNFFMNNHSPIRSLGIGTNYIHSVHTKQFDYNLPLYESYNNNSENIIKRLIVNRNKQSIKYNKKSIKNNVQGNITNSYSTATTKKNEGSLNSFQEDEDKSNNIKNIYKKYAYSLTTKRQKKYKKPTNIKNNKSQTQLSFENNLNMDNIKLNVGNIKDFIYSETRNDFRKINDDEIKKVDENEVEIRESGGDGDGIGNDDDEEYNIFDEEYFRLKGDFDLLYNDQYVNNIKNDLLKLEFELLFEKLIEMMVVYHTAMSKRINENKISKYKYNENRMKYILLNKLNNKLELTKNKNIAKDALLYENRSIIRQYNNKNLSLNKDEFNIFNKIFCAKNININKNLKEILNIIVNNNNNKNVLGNGKLKEGLRKKQIVKINVNSKGKNNTNNNGKKIRKKIIPKKQLTKISSKKNIIEFNNDKLHNNLKGEGIYTKKYPKTPLYNIKTSFN